MAKPINMHDAKSQLSRLVKRALAGEDVVIARAGHPLVRLVPVATAGRRKLGRWRGKVRMSTDFDAPLPDEILRSFGVG